jgi:hypothetical protein
MEKRIQVFHLFKGVDGAMAQQGTKTSYIIDLRHKNIEANFAHHMINVGGSITATLLVCSTRDGTFMAPTTPVVIHDSKVAGSYYEAFSPPTAPFMKILYTEIDAGAITSLNAWLTIQ